VELIRSSLMLVVDVVGRSNELKCAAFMFLKVSGTCSVCCMCRVIWCSLRQMLVASCLFTCSLSYMMSELCCCTVLALPEVNFVMSVKI